MSAFELIRQVALKLDGEAQALSDKGSVWTSFVRRQADDLWLAYRELEEMVDVAWTVVDNYEPYTDSGFDPRDEDWDGVKDDPLSRAMVDLHQFHLRLYFPRKEYR